MIYMILYQNIVLPMLIYNSQEVHTSPAIRRNFKPLHCYALNIAMLHILFLKIIICINGYKPVPDIHHQWLSIPEYLQKMFKSMHMQVIVVHVAKIFLTSTVFFGTVKEYVAIMK